tara:strand:+ start:528 stop:839 length:312 start_codon:yes stop_codon:yes gene_type:complete
MVMYKIVNGIKVQMSSTEETARLAEEKAWNDGAFDEALEELRIKRNELLAESDWTQMMDITDTRMDNLTKGKWQTYRENLRDITDGLTTEAEVKSVTWPTKPS